MANYYLDFEQPLKEIDQKILELEGDSSSHKEELSLLTSEREDCLKKIFSNYNKIITINGKPNIDISFDEIIIDYIPIKFLDVFSVKTVII